VGTRIGQKRKFTFYLLVLEMENPAYQVVYGVGILDDIHNYFPALLYEQGRFQNITNVFSYVRHQLNTRFNLFSYGASLARASASASASAIPTTPAGQIPRSFATAGQIPTSFATSGQMPTSLFTPMRRATVEEEEIMSSIAGASALLNMLNLGLGEPIAGPGQGTIGSVTPRAGGGGGGVWAAFRSPVIVAPSAAVLSANTTIINGGEIPQPDTTCTICQDIIVNTDVCRRLTACGHIYHKVCIDQWFNRSVFCPSCRHDVRDATIVSPRLQGIAGPASGPASAPAETGESAEPPTIPTIDASMPDIT
jgi:hypothetical protein